MKNTLFLKFSFVSLLSIVFLFGGSVLPKVADAQAPCGAILTYAYYSPARVYPGQSTTLYWDVTNTTVPRCHQTFAYFAYPAPTYPSGPYVPNTYSKSSTGNTSLFATGGADIGDSGSMVLFPPIPNWQTTVILGNEREADQVQTLEVGRAADSQIAVRVVDENDQPLSGGMWNVTGPGGAVPTAGSGSSLTHQTYPDPSYGTVFTVTSPTNLGARELFSITSNLGGGRVYIAEGQSEVVTIKYINPLAPQPPCTINLKGNSSDGPLTVSSGSSVNLTWTSANALSVNGNGFNTGGATQNTVGVVVNPTSNTTYTINGTDNFTGCSDSVVVNVTSVPPGPGPKPTVDIKANDSDAPAAIGYGSSANLTWTTTENPTSCLASIGWTGTKNPNGGSQSTGVLFSSVTYVITCENANGDATDQVTVNVNAPPPPPSGPLPVVDLKVNGNDGPIGTMAGIAYPISWTVSNADSCTATNNGGNANWNGNKSPSGGTEQSSPINNTTVFTLTCNNVNGPASDTVRVDVPSVDLTVDGVNGPITIPSGTSALLKWTTQGNPDICNASGDWSGSKNINGGSESTGPLTSAKTYVLTCHTPTGGNYSDQVTVNIGAAAPAAPTVSLRANGDLGSTSITSGSSANLIWTTTNAPTSCTASNAWSGAKNVGGGSESTGPLSATRTYVLSCTNAAGTGTSQVTVNIGPVSTASITVNSNQPSSWNLSPGVTPTTGSGTFTNHSATPNAAGTIYTLSNVMNIPGYTSAVTSSLDGGPNAGPSVTAFPGNNLVYTITYTSIAAPSAFNYRLTAASVTASQGSSGQSRIRKILMSGTGEPVTLTATAGVPAGVAITGYPSQGCLPTCNGYVNLSVGPSVAPGTYSIVITGVSTPSNITKTTNMSLTVTPPASFTADFVPPTNGRVGESINIPGIASGGTPPCVFTWTGTEITIPVVGQTFNFNYQTTGTKSLTLTVNCNGITRTVTKSFNIGVNLIIKEF